MTTFQAFPRMVPFDRNCDFFAARKITIQGINLIPGDKINKDLMTTRTLRQLYEQRWIKQVEAVEAAEDPVNSKPDFTLLPDEAIINWLESRKVIPRFGASREKLLSLADKTWKNLHNGVSH